ncbi:hypothetical protein [Clostridium sp.]|uniref:hypothetical protein n=1 Tax=Clostridium sp. TaxID=1506 RepID=UPI002FC925F6
MANHLWEGNKRNEAIKICMDIISKNPKDKLMIRSFLKIKHIPNNLPTINKFRSNEEAIHYM